MQGEEGSVRKGTEAGKAAAIAVAATAMALAFAVRDTGGCAMRPGCTTAARLAYTFIHANPVHAAINAWCLLALAFRHGFTPARLAAAYALAAAAPAATAAGIFRQAAEPAVGMSAMIYVLAASFRGGARYRMTLLASAAMGFAVPGIAAWLHVYGWAAGTALAALAPERNGAAGARKDTEEKKGYGTWKTR